MNYVEKLENVTVLGAAGKMGSGILLLVAQEMWRQKVKPENRSRNFVLYAMDVSNQALEGLMAYIRSQSLKYAEKNIVALRKAYSARRDLVENKEIIDEYVREIVGLIRPGTRIEEAFDSRIVFEAVSERPDLKVHLLLTINRNSRLMPWFFSNTSAIPIAWLDEQAGLEGRIMGVHFYNPPAVQKMLEVVKTETTHPELSYFVTDFLKNTGKIAVPAYDVAGFIGNGYLMRDILFAEQLVADLQKDRPFTEALYIVNKLSQDFLIRPMGIFQLADYVGVDVVHFIMSVMDSYDKTEKLHSNLIDSMIANGIRGGQNHNGSQKDGFFQYKEGRIAAVYDSAKRRYTSSEDLDKKAMEYLGSLPSSWSPWKKMKSHPEKDELLRVYFKQLKEMSTPGSKLAMEYLKRFREIGTGLVKNKVAFKFDDVNSVLINGFQHCYGPVGEIF